MNAYDAELELAARTFMETRSASARERLCEAALPLVRRMALSILRRLPPHFTPDDLIGDGCVGLVRAVDRFDPARGMRFEAWAARLVRGAILNGLRTMDLIPERVRRDARSLDRARWRLAQHQGTAPTDSAAAVRAGLSERKLNAVLLALRRSIPASLDAPPPLAAAHTPALGERLAGQSEDLASTVADRAIGEAVASAVRSLPAREQRIIASFYTGGSTFRTIGDQLGISKQRVSQIHGRALESLRTILVAQHLDA